MSGTEEQYLEHIRKSDIRKELIRLKIITPKEKTNE